MHIFLLNCRSVNLLFTNLFVFGPLALSGQHLQSISEWYSANNQTNKTFPIKTIHIWLECVLTLFNPYRIHLNENSHTRSRFQENTFSSSKNAKQQQWNKNHNLNKSKALWCTTNYSRRALHMERESCIFSIVNQSKHEYFTAFFPRCSFPFTRSLRQMHIQRATIGKFITQLFFSWARLQSLPHMFFLFYYNFARNL